MAKKEKDDKQEQDKQEPMTLQEYIIARLEMPVAVKGGGTLKDPVDGHEMSATEAIAFKMVEKALSGDSRAATFCMQLQASDRLQRKHK